MKFEDVIEDIKKLVGKTLNSIKPGANVQVVRVSTEENQIELVNSKGKRRTRPVTELRLIWDQLCLHPVVHVETVLSGSGSSRNQPETIFANLPYIEVVHIDGKKHIALVGKPTHSIGTLREMDAIFAHKVRTAAQETRQALPAAIIITEDTRPISSILEGFSGLRPTSLIPGIYCHKIQDKEILVVGMSSVSKPLPVGVYIPFDSNANPGDDAVLVRIGEEDYYHIVRRGVNILMRSKGALVGME